jgi:hypothetical protein
MSILTLPGILPFQKRIFIVNKKVIYTALYGNKDILKNPLVTSDDCDYVCFTNNKDLKSDIWECRYSPATHSDPVRSAKTFKIKPHEYFPDYEISLWVDANFLIKSDINSFLDKTNSLKDTNMLLFQHDQGRDCIYDEAQIIIADQKDDPELVNKQMKKYKLEDYPPNHGLTANSILLRRHNSEDIVNLSELWWAEIEKFSRRDQLSFCYCLWKLSTKYYLLKYPNVNIRNNKWFHWLPHNFELQKWS